MAVSIASVQDLEREQHQGASRRLAEREPERSRNRETLKRADGLLQADTPDRIAKRLDRLARYYASADLPTRPEEVQAGDIDEAAARVQDVLETAARKGAAPHPPQGRRVLERIINSNDFLDVRFLEGGAAAARAVGRVWIQDENQNPLGYGSGWLVTPRLLLTNHHVLPTPEIADASRIEFNFQIGLDGQPLHAVTFDLDPEEFWIAEEAADFALVAVHDPAHALEGFGYLRLIGAEGKAIVGECVNIIQHPRGERKRVAIRENRIVDLIDDFLHYETDTEPGSSGSPVFNDQWEVVALHHASVARPSGADSQYANEGIRVSRLLQHVFAAGGLKPPQLKLRDQLNNPESARTSIAIDRAIADVTHAPDGRSSSSTTSGVTVSTRDGGGGRMTPIEVLVRIDPALFGSAGTDQQRGATVSTFTPARGSPVVAPGTDRVEEAISIDPDYSTRAGYESGFLGRRAEVPLPELSPAMQRRAAVSGQPVNGMPDYVLPYHHFSVAISRERRMAFFTAVNIDGTIAYRLKRETDKWIYDPRIARTEQLGNETYKANALDRGHLVRRLDPAWGTEKRIAKVANDDTFHFTNCSPQHEDFNQNDATWQGLENYILDNAIAEELKVSVFSGPVFARNDPEYRGARLPKQFWKVVAMVTDGGRVSATAYLLSQASLLADLESTEFTFGAYRTFQVPVDRVERLTGLSFGRLRDLDPLRNRSAGAVGRESTAHRSIISLEDIVF